MVAVEIRPVNALGKTLSAPIRVLCGLVVAGALLGACSGGGDSTAPQVGAVVVNPPALSLTGLGTTGSLVASVVSARGIALTNATVSWTTDNSSVATVGPSGTTTTVTAVGSGTASITATSGGVSATATVTVTGRVLSVTVNPATLQVSAGATGTLTAVVNADLGVSRTVTWETSAPNVATVSPSGVVTAVSRGSATITARSTADATKSGSAIVTVPGVASVTVSPKPLSLARGSTQVMNATISVDPGVSNAVTWRSSNPAAAGVSATGLVTAVNPGTAFVVATATADATKRDSSLVTVPDACDTPIAYTLGATVNGTISISDCQGGRSDLYQVSPTSLTFFAATLTPATTTQALAPLQELFYGFSATPTVRPTLYTLVSAGSRIIQVFTSDSTQRGAYSLNTVVNPAFPAGCPDVWASLGVTMTFTLSATCPAYVPNLLVGSFTAQLFRIGVSANKTLRVTATASPSAARIELKLGTTLVASAFASGSGAPAVLTFTPTTTVNYFLYITTQNAGGTGSFTITIDP